MPLKMLEKLNNITHQHLLMKIFGFQALIHDTLFYAINAMSC